VCSLGELTVALRAGFDPARIGLHGNNKSEDLLRRRAPAGVGRIIVDSADEIARLERLGAELGVRPDVLIRVTTGVEAHTHEYIATAHEDQKFGFSIAAGRRWWRWCAATAARTSTSSASTATSARRSSTPTASRWRPAGRCG
jgi:diaminopimelate decarboxylase